MIDFWDTFFYANCCPQDKKLNKGSWNVLEKKVRTWLGSLEVFLSLPVRLWGKTRLAK